MSEEYISKEEIIDECRRYGNHEHNVQFKPDVSKDRKHDSEVAMFMCEHFRKFVKELPSADVRENIHAYWEDLEPDKDILFKSNMPYRCTACGQRAGKHKVSTYKYCPSCGAIMDGEPKVTAKVEIAGEPISKTIADMREPIGEKCVTCVNNGLIDTVCLYCTNYNKYEPKGGGT